MLALLYELFIIAHVDEIGEEVRKLGGLKLLVPMLFQEDDDNVRAMTARALRNLCESGNPLVILKIISHFQFICVDDVEENREYLVSQKVVEFAVRLIAEIDDDDNMVGELFGILQSLSATSISFFIDLFSNIFFILMIVFLTETVLNDLITQHDIIGASVSALSHLEEVPTIADVAEFLQSIAENGISLTCGFCRFATGHNFGLVSREVS